MEPTDLQEPESPAIPLEPALPIYSRFLFVDVAAMRAKQLRRGALPRLQHEHEETPGLEPHKAERIAMEEVRLGLVQYEIPAPPGTGRES